MNTPVTDFVKNYCEKDTIRAHMPGHKGKGQAGFEHLDITEIKGADSLFEADSVIRESEQNAGSIFGAHTFYSTEGSSLCIRAMMYLVLQYAKVSKKAPKVLATRNAHKTFLSAVSLLDMDVEWLYGEHSSYLSCDVSPQQLDKVLCNMDVKPVAVYVTSPDYLGNILDIKALSAVCKNHGVLFICDNAHGAYLKFLGQSLHPVDLGVDMCCDSAHKTLPVLTGGAYLHISESAHPMFKTKAKKAMALFASTSPSYLILQSLDSVNGYLSDDYPKKLSGFVDKVDLLKKELKDSGFELTGNEPLKLTVCAKSYGYTGYELSDVLRESNIECEFSDPDYLVLMLTPSITDREFESIKTALLCVKKRDALKSSAPHPGVPRRMVSVREAVMSDYETIDAKDSAGRVLASVSVSCPPAVPVVVSGELIDESAVKCFEYYNITQCDVMVNN